jgi:hypothetical protein
MTVAEHQGSFQIGRVVSRTFGVISRNFVIFLAAAALIMLPVVAIDFYNGTPNAVASGLAKGWRMAVVAFAVQIVCTYLLQASLVRGAITDMNGERPTLGSALSTGFGLIVPVFIISILFLLGMTAGMVLLIVPGIMLAVAWSVVIPVRVVENTGISETFGRSRALTKGYRWPIFWLVVLYTIAAILTGALIGVVAGVSFGRAATVNGNIPYIVMTWAMQVVLAIVSSVGVSAVYYELRTVKEGIAPEQLAAAFD